ncbi:hypothetical protein LMG28688_06712 [Paraburkholderia caffeinitolerans]|uniref:Uncharacterized protein n=1 Tax=Paraburkholderia caffeinitolerans TaxID=1723730 RepID=A0A6J5GZN7_9BURK|nr:hypothetical protein [Paraburkholderia caffeinitolerans]CAB3808184.1 hypothetical protein LMG28688_06712 [Paraburkholderia caffeinitolerans]
MRHAKRKISPLRFRSKNHFKKYMGVSSALQIVQLLAIVVGAAWTLFIYLSYGRQLQTLNALQLKISNNQAEIQLHDAQQIHDVDLEAKKAERIQQIKDLKVGKVKITQTLDISCDGFGKYAAVYHYDIENIAKSDVEVSWTLIERFSGVMDKKRPSSLIVPLNEPPILAIPRHTDGIITWTLQGYSGAYFGSDRARKSIESLPMFNFDEWGQGTMNLHPGEKSEGTDRLAVFAKPGDFIGEVLSMELNDGLNENGDNRTHLTDWRQLPFCELPVARSNGKRKR